MRTLLRIRMGTEAGSKAIANGTIERLMRELVDRIKPEAAYFFPDRGKRSASFVFDMQDSSTMPMLLEPFFKELDAEVQLVPVMNLEDLEKGLTALAA